MAQRLSLSVHSVSFVCVAIVAFVLLPSPASALNSEEAYDEFSVDELSQLFEEASSFDDSEYVMHDYESEEDTYLKLRDKFSDRYFSAEKMRL